MKYKNIAIVFFKHFPLYLLFSVSFVHIVSTTLTFRSTFTPFDDRVFLYSMSFITIFFSVYLTFKSYRNIDTARTLISADAAIIGFLILIGIIALLILTRSLDHEGTGFVFIFLILCIAAILTFFLLNIIGFIVHKRFYVKGTFIFLGAIGLLIITGMIMGFYSYANSNKLYQHLKKSKPIQFLYKYATDIYYVTSQKKGIFKMTPQGETITISHADIDIANTWDFKFCVDGDVAYFEDREGWKRISLIDLKIGEAKDPGSSQVEYISHLNEYIFGKDAKQFKNILIQDYQVIGDGYIYYSTKAGLYRVNLKNGSPELIVSGDITLFNIKGKSIYYYDVNRGYQLNSLTLKE